MMSPSLSGGALPAFGSSAYGLRLSEGHLIPVGEVDVAVLLAKAESELDDHKDQSRGDGAEGCKKKYGSCDSKSLVIVHDVPPCIVVVVVSVC